MARSDRLAALQTEWKRRGWYAGLVDGLWGDMSLAAAERALEAVPAPEVPTGVPAAIAALLATQPRSTRRIDEIIVHCTATPAGREVSVDTIRVWHLARGWDDIGYHYVVHLNGVVEAGRPEAKVGAHVEGHNTGTLGVVYVGGVDPDDVAKAEDTRTPAQREALMALCRGLAAKYPAIRTITGHNQYAAKACPSFDVRTDPLGSILK